MTVALFTLGGTISMAGEAPGGGGVVARLTGRDLTAAVPGLADLGEDLEIHDVEAVPSATPDLRAGARRGAAASRAIEAGASGVVLSQGTDTLEETAFLVDLVWPHPEPFVVTGAMRNPTLAGPDGPANLLAAARVAASPDARSLGALVVLNDEIHAARWVRKQHSTSTATFGSPDVGALGHVIEGRVRVLTRPPRAKTAPLARPRSPGGATGGAPRRVPRGRRRPAGRAADTHDGLVVAGFGVGHVPAALAPRLGALAERIPVVLTSRTGGGSVLSHTYGAPGSEVDLLRRGLVNGGLLDPYKARVLLRLLLAVGVGPRPRS